LHEFPSGKETEILADKRGCYVFVRTRYGEVMTVLIVLVVFGAAIALVVGYVAWRDRRSRGSFVHPSVSRDALIQADRQAVQGRLADVGMPVADFLQTRSSSRASRA
jgi:hypothetical protein